jgi:hypothetical protein
VYAVAELPEKWPLETGIFSLGSFLGALSTFNNPKVEFGEDSFVLSEGKTKIKYRYSDPSTIMTPPNKVLKTANPKVEFKLSAEALVQLNKTCAMLELDIVTITTEAGDVVLRASAAKNPASHNYEYTVPAEDVSGGKENLSITFKHEHFALLMEGTYQVALADWSYGYFKHADEPISYFLVAQA